MPKISTYPLPQNLSSGAYLITRDGNDNFKVKLANAISKLNVNHLAVGIYKYDFWQPPDAGLLFSPQPWIYALIGAGSISQLTLSGNDYENHPGFVRINQSGANTGAAIHLGHASNILLAGEEETELIARINSLTNTVLIFGFSDTMTAVGVPSDGVIIIWNGTNITGRAYNSGVVTSTATSYTPTDGVWYRFKIVLNSNATRADFYIYDEAGNLLWTDNVTSNIPTAAGRECSHGANAYKTTAGTVAVADFDYISLFMPRTLTR